MPRSRALAIVVVALGCLPIGVSAVAAKPKPLSPKTSPVKLLPHRSCKGLPTGGGEDVLAVYPRLDYAPKGKPTDIVGPLIAQVDKAQNTVTSLHGVGTRAYVVIDEEGNGVGVMQVRNDVFEVFKESPAGIGGLLAKVAGELGRS